MRSAIEKGLDLVGVYESPDGVGVSVAESKASERYGQVQLGRAISLYRALDEGRRDQDLLQALNLLIAYLPPHVRESAPEAFWEGRRMYAPLVVFCRDFNPGSNRPGTLGGLSPPHDGRRLITACFPGYASFFTAVVAAMWRAVARFT